MQKQLSTAQLSAIRVQKMPLSARFAAFLGHLPAREQFSMLVWGLAGSGKSTLALQIAAEFARFGRVLYTTSEEKFTSGTLQTRLRLCKLENARIDWLQTHNAIEIDKHLKTGLYKYCVLDSLNELHDGGASGLELLDVHKRTAFMFLAQSVGNGKKHLGASVWRHVVDIVIKCENKKGKRVAMNEKNRYGATQHELLIF